MRGFLGVLCIALCAPLGATEVATWKDANKESARILREQGPTAEAAGLARRAFDLYPDPGGAYHVRTHAQLLLNAVEARKQATTDKTALQELDRGIDVIADKAGVKEPLLVELWREGLSIARRGALWRRVDDYHKRRTALAADLYGKSDARTILMYIEWAADLRQHNGYEWTREKLRSARHQAAPRDEHDSLVLNIDLHLAKLEIESGNPMRAITLYGKLIDRLTASSDPEATTLLQLAYAQLELAHERAGDKTRAADARARLVSTFGAAGNDQLRPLTRVAPTYPRRAASRWIEGYVEVVLTIGADGTVQDARVIAADPPHLFDEAALEAVRRWTFVPKIIDGKPVTQAGLQRIDFRMNR